MSVTDIQPHSSASLLQRCCTPACLSCKQKCVELEGKNFIKLAKDTKLLSKALTTTDIDLIFAKVSSLLWSQQKQLHEQCCSEFGIVKATAFDCLEALAHIRIGCSCLQQMFGSASAIHVVDVGLLLPLLLAGEGQGRTQDHLARVCEGAGPHRSKEGTLPSGAEQHDEAAVGALLTTIDINS
jgi:hypothetical protein